jgi:hypothetical protein
MQKKILQGISVALSRFVVVKIQLCSKGLAPQSDGDR